MSFNPFSYEETVSTRYLRFLNSEFSLESDISNEALFIRLLAGTLRCTNVISSESFDQFENFFILGRDTNSLVNPGTIKRCIEPDMSFSKVCSFLKDSTHLNHSFFEHLLIEITSCLYKKQKGQHTIAFLHLYRALEYISYSFPLIYASRSRDYYGSFNRIKNYFDTSKNELSFFEVFVKKIFGGLGYLEAPVTFNLNTLINQININHYDIIKKLVKEDKIVSDIKNTSITICYEQLLGLCIDLRNRYFHFTTGDKRNIRGIEILESDLLFATINDEFLNWIALIYYEILKTFCE